MSALMMFRRLWAAIKSAAEEEGFRAVFGAAISLIILGTVTYSLTQHWSPADAFYFTVATLTTSSVADPNLTLDGAPIKIFTSFFVLTGIGILVETVRRIGIGYMRTRTRSSLSRESEADGP